MHYPKFIESNQKEESISIQRVNFKNKSHTGGNVVRGNRTVMQMKSLRDHPDMSYGSNKQWNQLCE